MSSKILTLSLILSLGLLSCKEQKEVRNSSISVQPEQIEVQSETPVASEEEFALLDQEEIDLLNEKIAIENLNTEEDIIRTYLPEDLEAEGNYSYHIEKLNENGTLSEYQLIENHRMDDSLKGIKVIMTFEKTENGLRVTEIKKSFQCWENRGHENWSAELCQ